VRHQLGDNLFGSAPRLLNHRNVELALLGITARFGLAHIVQPGAAQKPGNSLLGSTHLRPFALLAHIGRPRGQPAQIQRQPPRSNVRFDAFIGQAGIDQAIGDQLAQIIGGFLLHAGGNFFGKQFEKKIRHQLAPPSRVCT
jgi:hypothetical protein